MKGMKPTVVRLQFEPQTNDAARSHKTSRPVSDIKHPAGRKVSLARWRPQNFWGGSSLYTRRDGPQAPVAQLDRAAGFEPVGRGFESLRAHQIIKDLAINSQSKQPIW